MTTRHPYSGRTAVLATMHGKERAFAPPLNAALGLRVSIAPAIDTDTLGTFTIEVPRHGTMLEVAVRKARLGMAATGLELGIASEGSFGPHPHVPFAYADMELAVLVDVANGLVISESLVTTDTNFASATVRTPAEAHAFLERAGFPSHAVIASPNEVRAGAAPRFRKALADEAAVAAAIAYCVAESVDGAARLQTDMRAHLNPTRMTTLSVLAERLAARVAKLCAGCGAPGFGVVDTRRGLPCGDCGTPTELAAEYVDGCVRCERREARPRGDGVTTADPSRCPYCNP